MLHGYQLCRYFRTIWPVKGEEKLNPYVFCSILLNCLPLGIMNPSPKPVLYFCLEGLRHCREEHTVLILMKSMLLQRYSTWHQQCLLKDIAHRNIWTPSADNTLRYAAHLNSHYVHWSPTSGTPFSPAGLTRCLRALWYKPHFTAQFFWVQALPLLPASGSTQPTEPQKALISDDQSSFKGLAFTTLLSLLTWAAQSSSAMVLKVLGWFIFILRIWNMGKQLNFIIFLRKCFF